MIDGNEFKKIIRFAWDGCCDRSLSKEKPFMWFLYEMHALHVKATTGNLEK